MLHQICLLDFPPTNSLKQEVFITFENTYCYCKKHSVMIELIQNDFNPFQSLTSNTDEN